MDTYFMIDFYAMSVLEYIYVHIYIYILQQNNNIHLFQRSGFKNTIDASYYNRGWYYHSPNVITFMKPRSDLY